MPSKHAKQSSARDTESSPQDEGDARRGGQRGPAPARAPRASHAEANSLLMLGLACTAGGAALSLLPRFSWQAAQLTTGLDQLGIHGGAIAIGGLVLMGLARVRRQLSDAALHGPTNDDLLFEQVASDMVQTRNALEHLQALTSGIQSELAGLSGEVARLAVQREQPAIASGGNDDALFGIAASLDKLGYRLEQRLKSQHDALQDSFEEMHTTLVRSRRNVDESGVSMAAVVAPEAATEYAQGEPENVSDEPRQDLNSLGLLDTLDDYGTTAAALPQRATPSTREIDALDDLRRHIEREIAPARSTGSSWEEELNLVESHSTPSKLDQLRALLADEEVRAALGDWHAGQLRTAT